MQFPTMAMDTVRKFVIAEDRPYDTALWPIYEDVSRLVRETQTKAAGTDKEPSINRALKQQMLTQRCKDVVKHLESNRANFLLAGADPKTSDWAIQNARLVVQYVQMKTGEKSRDESMAENVKWIADHSPGAKLVLWAHNGHVGYKGSYRFTPMGGYLRSTFGTELVNFGFAFNEGSFRAVELGKGLHDFTVGKLPEGSLDGTLGSAGIPFLAMDLRQMPKEGPVAEWLSQPRDTRSIGAVYSETTSSVQMMRPQDSYDVLLFINKTTAARANH
jgi:erythromycin esterase